MKVLHSKVDRKGCPVNLMDQLTMPLTTHNLVAIALSVLQGPYAGKVDRKRCPVNLTNYYIAHLYGRDSGCKKDGTLTRNLWL